MLYDESDDSNKSYDAGINNVEPDFAQALIQHSSPEPAHQYTMSVSSATKTSCEPTNSDIVAYLKKIDNRINKVDKLWKSWRKKWIILNKI